VKEFKITELWAYVSTDDVEGIAASYSRELDMMAPMIGADKDRLISLKPEAQKIADLCGKELVLKRFQLVEDSLEVITPND
jgi:hypothetical protein